MKLYKKRSKRPHRPRRFPYYKIQIYDDKVAAWVDIQKAFYSTEDLILYASDKIGESQKFRIMIVKGERERNEFAALEFRK